MICPNCGKENVDRSPFCAQCGQALVSVDNGVVVNSTAPESAATSASQPASQPTQQPQTAAQAASQPEAAAQPAAAQAAQAASQPEPHAAPQAAPQPTPQPTPQPAPQAASQPVAQPARPLYAKSCMGAAWSDITSSEGWFKKILLLGLIMCVPILNFYVIGYAMRWSRQLVLGKIEQMPQRIFEEGNFSQGFYAWVWMLVLGLVVSIASGILDFIPFIGFLAVIALSLFECMFSYIGALRIAISKQIGQGFNISEDWKGFTKNFGSLCGAAILPNLIIGAIIIFVVLIAVFIGVFLGIQAGLTGASYAWGYGYGSGYSDLSLLMSFLGSLVAFIPLFLVMYVVLAILQGFAYIWTFRSVGHYVARELPEWKSLAEPPVFYQPMQ